MLQAKYDGEVYAVTYPNQHVMIVTAELQPIMDEKKLVESIAYGIHAATSELTHLLFKTHIRFVNDNYVIEFVFSGIEDTSDFDMLATLQTEVHRLISDSGFILDNAIRSGENDLVTH